VSVPPTDVPDASVNCLCPARDFCFRLALRIRLFPARELCLDPPLPVQLISFGRAFPLIFFSLSRCVLVSSPSMSLLPRPTVFPERPILRRASGSCSALIFDLRQPFCSARRSSLSASPRRLFFVVCVCPPRGAVPLPPPLDACGHSS